MHRGATILTVSQLNRYIGAVLEEDRKLSDVYVKGEISNFTRHFKSGHLYFSVRDEGGLIRAVMFKSHASDLRFDPENGMSVLIRASVGVYERDGAYQLYVTDIQPDGAGALAAAFEQRKRKLMQLGMFDERHKKPLPEFPRRVGVVTSQAGAALQDIINVISRRYPLCTLVVCHAQVQGTQAAESVARALKTLDENGRCDVIIVGRGGGSAEDLWAFNEEPVAYAVFEARTPVVSAVGHETDFTICDFVADLRAPTPSAAAELVVPSVHTLRQKVTSVRSEIMQGAYFMLERNSARMRRMRRSPGLSSPMNYISKNQQRLDFFTESLYNKKQSYLYRLGQAVKSRAALLESLSPVRVMARGYCAAFQEGRAVTEAATLKAGDELDLSFYDGTAKVRVLEEQDEKGN